MVEYRINIIVLSVFLITASQLATDAKVVENLATYFDLKPYVDRQTFCLQNNSIDKDDILRAHIQLNTLDEDTLERVKCYRYCLFEHGGFLHKNGSFNRNGMYKFHNDYIRVYIKNAHYDKNCFESFVEKCESTFKGSPRKCENAQNFVLCMSQFNFHIVVRKCIQYEYLENQVIVRERIESDNEILTNFEDKIEFDGIY